MPMGDDDYNYLMMILSYCR